MPCCHCSKLLTPDEVKWVPFDINFSYNLLLCFPQIGLFHHPNDSCKIACCKTCVDTRKRRFPPQLDPIPTEISSVPMFHRRWLSPIHLSCSLGRSENSNPFTTFRHLSGTFNLSRNRRAHALYTGDIGAIFTENSGSTWFHHTLVCAVQWLSTHNPVISNKGYALLQSQAQSQSISTFPTATLVNPASTNSANNNNNVQLLRPSAAVVPPSDLNPEIHNEDFQYNRSSGITLTSIRRVTNSFLINGAPCSRTQFPLQNAFALTVHKTQGLTLPHVSLSIDDTMFACGQVYVAFSRATSWENLDLYAFEEDQIHIDQEVITENQRLWSLFIQRFPQQ